MTVYVTPYSVATKECTAASTDSGFSTIEQAVEIMGEPDKRYTRMALYIEGGSGVAVSNFPFRIDGDGTKG